MAFHSISFANEMMPVITSIVRSTRYEACQCAKQAGPGTILAKKLPSSCKTKDWYFWDFKWRFAKRTKIPKSQWRLAKCLSK